MQCFNTCPVFNPDAKAAATATINRINALLPYIDSTLASSSALLNNTLDPIKVTGDVSFTLPVGTTIDVVSAVALQIRTELPLFTSWPFAFVVRLVC